MQEAEWAGSRPESRKGKSGDASDDGTDSHDEIDFEGCLTQWEQDAYMKYQRDYPGSVYSLNQNPDTRATCAKQSAARHVLFVLDGVFHRSRYIICFQDI